MKTASFQIDVSPKDALRFAELSGDWNPLHTDPGHASKTEYKNMVLHGAFSAGLISRIAGMHIPGADCLLHNMKLRFIAPIIPPASLTVSARLVSETGGVGRVEANVSDRDSGVRYVQATYEFGHHKIGVSKESAKLSIPSNDEAPILVIGASGGVGSALLKILGNKGLGISRGDLEGSFTVPDITRIGDVIGNRPIKSIVHCAWPAPDNVSFSMLDDPRSSIKHHVSEPLESIHALTRHLIDHGTENASLILIGSTFAKPGRHNFRMPLYSVAKAMLPALSNILALELAPYGRRCFSVVFDVIDGGMNAGINNAVRLSHADRSPSGKLATTEEAALQIMWLLENQSHLISGATISLSGGAMP
ncbi:MAG: SDR family oxidoreductase [Magnetovibrio sp.]|nr:SDR family oxidoreductase [Magnetovibrio sp.]